MTTPAFSLKSDVLLAAALAVLATVALLALPGTFLEGYDYVEMHAFYKTYFRDSVLAGEMPWWNPYTALGRPFFADIETATLYPATWLVLPLGVTAGVVTSVTLHLWLALWSMRRLAGALGANPLWSWLAALTFIAGGPLLARLQLGQLTVFAALCWLPAIFWLGLRLQEEPGGRPIVRLALAEGLCFLAGSPNILWLANGALALFLAVRCASGRELWTIVRRLAGAALLAGCLVSVQLWSFLELLGEGNRPLQAAGYATRFGMGASTWLSLFAPLGGPFRFAPEFNQYIGAPLALAGLVALVGGWRDRTLRALLAVAVVALILAAGDRLPLLGWLAQHVPGFGAMRYPSRYGLLLAFAGVLAAAVWLSGRPLPRAARGALATLQLLLLGYGAVRLAAQYRMPPAPHWDADLRADLASHGLFPASGVPPRIAFDRIRVRQNSGMVQGYSTLDGFANPMLRRTWVAAHREAGVPEPTFDFHQLDEAVYAHGPFPMPTAALVAGWAQEGGVTVFRSFAVAAPRATLASPGGSAEIVRFSRNRLDLRVNATVATTLSLAEPFYPGWRATVDGRETPVQLAHEWMRAVALPAGAREVTLGFRPRYLVAGIALTLAALGATAWLWRRTT